jgi:antibiotic biosynthesis monooxygenase (ABM) superfamily enzyme
MQTKDVAENAVTVIIGQPIRPGADKEFSTWQHGLNEAASDYPGFIDAEVTPAHR